MTLRCESYGVLGLGNGAPIREVFMSLQEREKKLQRLFMKKQLGNTKQGSLKPAIQLSKPRTEEESRKLEELFEAVARLEFENRKAVEEDTTIINESETAVQERQSRAGGQNETQLPTIVSAMPPLQEDDTEEEVLKLADQPGQSIYEHAAEAEEKDGVDDVSSDSD
jgi:hypothetical protein